MMASLLMEFVRLRSVVLFTALLILAFGGWRLPNLKIDLYPEFAGPRIEIQTEAPGLPAAEVEAFITVPLEEMLSGIPWVRSMQSRSVAGVSSIVLQLEADADVMNVRQMTQERLHHASALPKVSKPPTMLQPVSAQNRSNIIGLSSSSMPLIEMSVLARWKVKPRLLGVPGVANVAIWGERSRQLQILVDPARLQEFGVGLSEVVKAAGDSLWSSPLSYLQSSTPGNGGFIDTPNQRFDVRHILPISSAADLAKVTFLSAKGQRLSLGEVASVVEGHQPLVGDAVVDGKTGLMIVIEKFPGADTGEVTRGIEKALGALAPALPGVDIDTTLYRPASYIKMARNNLATTGLIGLCFAVAMFFLCTFDWRRTAVATLSVAISMVASLFVLQLAAIPVNAMVMVGLGMAMMISINDMLSATAALARSGHAEGSPRKESVQSIAVSTVASTLSANSLTLICSLAAGSTLLLLTDAIAALWKPAIVAFLTTMTVSYVTSVVILPSLVVFSGLAVHGGSRRSSMFRFIEDRLASIARSTFARSSALLGSAGLASLIVGATIVELPKILMPDFQELGVIVRLNTAPGVSLAKMRRDIDKIMGAVNAVPDVAIAGAQIGRAELSDRLSDVNDAELLLSMGSSGDVDANLSTIAEIVAQNIDTSSQRVVVDSYSAMRIAENIVAARSPVELRLYGPGDRLLDQTANELKSLLATVPGLVSPRVVEAQVEEHIEIEVDLAAAAQHGLKPGDVRRAASTLVSGLQVGTLFEGQKIFDVVVWGAPDTYSSVEKIGKLLINTPAGTTIALDEVADIRLSTSPNVYLREGASHFTVILAEMPAGSISAIRSEIEARLATFEFPAGFHAELMPLGPKSATDNPGILVGAASVLAALFLAALACIGGWRRTLLLFLLAPASLLGAIVVPISEGIVSAGHLSGFAVLAVLAFGGLLAAADRRGAERHLHTDAAASAAAAVSATSGKLAAAIMIFGFAAGVLSMGEVIGLELLHPMALVVVTGLPTLLAYLIVVVPAVVRGTAFEPTVDPGLSDHKESLHAPA